MNYRVGIYVRVSTEEQAQIKEGSIDTQKHRAKIFIDSKIASGPGWGKIVEIYADEGLSAKNTRRPAYQEMMKDIRKQRINLILVTDLSRLSRNIMDFCLLLEELKKYNAKFLSIKEQFDTSTATGEMMVFNMINLAQFERKQTSERVTMNFHARALRGLTNGAPILLGYKRNLDRPGSLVINESEATQVRRIFDIFLEEGSLSKALIKIREEGIKPRVSTNKNHFKVGRGIWTLGTLLGLLRNQTYIGIRVVNAKHKEKDQTTLRSYEKYQTVKASWPGIIDEVVFDEVQHELDKNRFRRAKGPRSRNYILTGILRCAECGDAFNGASAHGNSGVHRYYIHRSQLRPTCKIKRIRAGKTEDAILPKLGQITHQLGYFEIANKNLSSIVETRISSLKPEELRIKAQLLQIDKEIEYSLSLKEKEASSFSLSDVILGHLQKLKSDKINLETVLVRTQRGLESAQRFNINWADNQELICKFNSGWKKLRPFQQTRLLSRVFKEIIVKDDGFIIVCWPSFKRKEVYESSSC